MCTESNFKPSAQLNTCRSAEFHCKLSADLLPQACRVTASVSVSELIILVMLCERVGVFDEAAVDVMRVKQWQNCLSSSTRSDKSWRRGSIQYEKLAGLFIYTVNLSVYSLLPSSCRWIFELKVNTNSDFQHRVHFLGDQKNAHVFHTNSREGHVWVMNAANIALPYSHLVCGRMKLL